MLASYFSSRDEIQTDSQSSVSPCLSEEIANSTWCGDALWGRKSIKTSLVSPRGGEVKSGLTLHGPLNRQQLLRQPVPKRSLGSKEQGFRSGFTSQLQWTMITGREHLTYLSDMGKTKYLHASQVGCGGPSQWCILGCGSCDFILIFLWNLQVSEPSLPPRILVGHSQEVTSIAWCPSDFTKVCFLKNCLPYETIDVMWQYLLFKIAAIFVDLEGSS